MSRMSVNGVKITRGRRGRHGRKRHKGAPPQRESMITAKDCEAAARRIARATGSNVVLTPEEAARFARNVGEDPALVWRAPGQTKKREASRERFNAQREDRPRGRR